MPDVPAASKSKTRGDGRVARWLSVAAVVVIGLWAFNTYPVGVLNDDAVYVILAKSLATGRGYRYLNLPGAPAATHFPPVYPLILAPLWWLAPTLPLRIIVFKLLNVALLGVIANRLYQLLREHLDFSSKASGVGAVLLAASVPLLILAVVVMSETLFLAVVLIALVLAERAVGDSRDRRSFFIASALAGLSLLIRTNGVALTVAFGLALAANRRWRDSLIAIGVSLTALVPWQLWTSAHRGNIPDALQGAYGSYLGWIGRALQKLGPTFFVQVAASNLQSIAWTLSTAVVPVVTTPPRVVALIVVVGLAVPGVRTMWRGARTSLLFTIIYMGIVIVWPVEPARYVWGVWPLLVILPVVGARAIWRWSAAPSSARYLRLGACSLVLCAALGYLYAMGQGYRSQYWQNIPRAGAVALRPIVVGIRGHTKPGDVVATPAEGAMYLYTDHQTVPVYSYQPTQLFRDPTLPEKAAALEEILESYDATSIVTTSEGERRVIDNVVGVSRVPSDTFPGGMIFEVTKQ